MRRILPSIFTSLLIILSFTLLIPQTHAAVLSGWGTATIDGVINPSEWAGADTLPFSVGPGPYTGTIYMMNDATNFYIAITVNGDTNLNFGDGVLIHFDNDNGGEATLEVGDDYIWHQDLSLFRDDFWMGASYAPDASFGGTTDGSSVASRVSSTNHFELSHPLDSTDDSHDFSLSTDQRVGFHIRVIVSSTGYDLFGGSPTNPSTWLHDYQVASAHVYSGQTTDSYGRVRTGFLTSESVYATGSGFPSGFGVDIYITEDLSWMNGMSPTDISSDGVNTVTTNGAGDFGPVLVWPATTTVGEYDIVIDVDQDNKYSLGIDHVNDPNHPGFSIVEYGSSSVAVGGFYAPVNSFAVLLPYLAIVGVIGIITTILVARKEI